MDLAGFRSALGDIPIEDEPNTVLLRSRDHYWYSPILKAKLDDVTADLVVIPRTKEDVTTTLRAAFAHDVPITPRGASTGNYGQAMPLKRGAMLDLRELKQVIEIKPDRVRCEAGIFMNKLDEQTKEAVGGELRFHPSTYRMATIGGFIAGGSGGIGSIRWGGLRNLGNVLACEVITCETEPRTLHLTGADVQKVVHAYGTNGIIVECEMPLAPAYEWLDVMAGFDDIIDACKFAEMIGRQDGILLKEIAPIAAPVPYDYFGRYRDFVRRDQSAVLMMVAPASLEALLIMMELYDAALLFRSDRDQPQGRGKLPPLYEYSWNHTTLRGLKLDPSITYLQTQYPDLETVQKIVGILGDEMPMHLEMIRFDGKVVFAGLPIVRYTSEERLEEIIKLHEDNHCLVFNPHRYTLEEGGMKQTNQTQLDFKREADPKGLLNPGKMIAWDDPDFDLTSGRVWLFPGLESKSAA